MRDNVDSGFDESLDVTLSILSDMSNNVDGSFEKSRSTLSDAVTVSALSQLMSVDG